MAAVEIFYGETNICPLRTEQNLYIQEPILTYGTKKRADTSKTKYVMRSVKMRNQ